MAALAFPDHAAGRRLAARAAALGLPAATFDPADPSAAVAAFPSEILHVHAGIGWEGHTLVAAGAQAGRAVIRTEHLPWLRRAGNGARPWTTWAALICPCGWSATASPRQPWIMSAGMACA